MRHRDALGGISRLTFEMNAASLPQIKMMRGIDAIATRVAPALHQEDNRSVARHSGTFLSPHGELNRNVREGPGRPPKAVGAVPKVAVM